MKKSKRILSALLLVSAACVGLTLAYLKTNTGALTNKFTIGEVTTVIEEDPKVNESTIEKDPKVVNLGPNDCLVRMRVTVSPKEIADYLEAGKHINYNTNKWTYNNNDGFWYYQGIVPFSTTDSSLNQTEELFTKVTGLTDENGQIVEAFQDVKNFQITLYQESVQAVVWDENGKSYSAYNDDRTYNEEGAATIWSMYDAGAIATP